MNVLVCGGRAFEDRDKVVSVLDEIHASTPIKCVIHGGAKGADALADYWATLHAPMRIVMVPADWSAYGRAAGPLRNARMLEWNPDLVIAFPGGRGTEDMVRKAEASGVPVRRIK